MTGGLSTRLPAAWSVGAIIPACNEEGRVGGCIRSVLRAAEFAHALERLWIVVVADSCSDRTVAEARAALEGRGEICTAQVRSAGTARRLGVAAALAHFDGRRPERTWLCNTDADSKVPLDWISHHLALAEQGITGIAGIVSLGVGADADTQRFFDATYDLNPDGTHGHVHGANLALRADAYLDVGGWSDLPLAEDHCLWGRLRAKGWRVCSPSTSVVTTSGRLVGRSAGGFADRLRRAHAVDA